MNFVICEYNQDSECDDTYTHRTFPIFNNEEDLKKYVKEHDIYGMVEVYEDNEYIEFMSSKDDFAEMPEPIETFDTQFILLENNDKI